MKFPLHAVENIEFVVIQTSFWFTFVSLYVISFVVCEVMMQ
jgi:hypothetical protein